MAGKRGHEDGSGDERRAEGAKKVRREEPARLAGSAVVQTQEEAPGT